MTRDSIDVTETELAVLRTLWEFGEATIRQLADRLYPGGGTSHYATVQKLLERLEGKGCVSHDQQGRVNVFRPELERGELIARRLRRTAEQLCEGSLTPLLTHLVGTSRLESGVIAALRYQGQLRTNGLRRV